MVQTTDPWHTTATSDNVLCVRGNGGSRLYFDW